MLSHSIVISGTVSVATLESLNLIVSSPMGTIPLHEFVFNLLVKPKHKTMAELQASYLVLFQIIEERILCSSAFMRLHGELVANAIVERIRSTFEREKKRIEKQINVIP